MGGGSWTKASYVTHSTTGRGYASMDAFNAASTQELYRSRRLESVLDPKNVMRECCDSDEHPNTVPVILALDVTGSMGSAASAIAKQLNDIMTGIYEKVKDVEFLVMAIGDLSYDSAPIQASQFESDIRIAEQLEKVYFEAGGGGNQYESYTAAWYFGLRHTKLDCWNRGKKGLIITMGDEMMNPYLPKEALARATGDTVQGDIDTDDLYKEVIEKFDVYHIAVDDVRTSYCHYADRIKRSWGTLLGDHLIIANCNSLTGVITDIVTKHAADNTSTFGVVATDEGISW